jgi:hypothetical protein
MNDDQDIKRNADAEQESTTKDLAIDVKANQESSKNQLQKMIICFLPSGTLDQHHLFLHISTFPKP